MAQTECIVCVIDNTLDSIIDSVKYAMIKSIDMRKPDLKVSDQVRHKPGSVTTCICGFIKEGDFTNYVAKTRPGADQLL